MLMFQLYIEKVFLDKYVNVMLTDRLRNDKESNPTKHLEFFSSLICPLKPPYK